MNYLIIVVAALLFFFASLKVILIVLFLVGSSILVYMVKLSSFYEKEITKTRNQILDKIESRD